MTDTFIKIQGIWHIKEDDTKINKFPAAVLLCTGAPVVKVFPESVGTKGDDCPLCDKCQNPFPTKVKELINPDY